MNSTIASTIKTHAYVLPYHIRNGTKYGLLGKKTCFNCNDGFIHNNPGQWVIVGGYSQEHSLHSALTHFEEESGHRLESKNVTHLITDADYVIAFCLITDDVQIVDLTEIEDKNPNYNNKKKQITDLKWFEMSEIRTLFKEPCKFNPVCGGYTSYEAFKYLQVMRRIKKIPKYEFQHFQKFVATNNKKQWFSRKRSPPILDLTDIIQNRNTKNDKIVIKYIEEYFYSRSFTDWFFSGISSFMGSEGGI